MVGPWDGDANYSRISPKEGAYIPYLEVTYTLPTNPEPIIKAAAEIYLDEHDEPKLKYKINMADMSKVISEKWEDESIELGDTVRVYDSDIGLNVDCRVRKIDRDLLNPENLKIELILNTIFFVGGIHKL